MRRVRLIHWNAEEARPRVAALREMGYEVLFQKLDTPVAHRILREDTPAAFVIDLTRMPSHGRDIALVLRTRKATRRTPIVFVEGDEEKVARIRAVLPDAVYTSWSRVGTALRRAIAMPPAEPVAPPSAMAGYSGTPLPKKLGIKPGFVVAMAGAPPEFPDTLGELPEGATLHESSRGRADLIVWFVRTRLELDRGIDTMADRAGAGPIWIAWPKKSSGVTTDVTENAVQKTGLDAGLVDYKVCAIDATWSGLLFRRRKK
ncbi:MAG: hypothetical protein ACRD96_20350 [Bryobacteraceae bacterium]